MLGCRRVRGLIAESLYEELSATDRGVLEGHLEKCSGCRAEAEALGHLVAAIPSTRAELDRDLVPVLRGRLREASTAHVFLGSRQVVVAAAACLVVAMVIGYAVMGGAPAELDSPVALAPAEEGPSLSPPLAAELAEAQRLAVNRDFSGAFMVLQAALDGHPDSELAGELQLLQADIAFAELQWYPQAFEAYNGLWLNHGDLFRKDPQNVYRWNLLDETRGANHDYALLHAVDAARHGDDFGGLEEVIGQKPATYVASLAAREMARLVVGAARRAAEEDTRLYAMQSALDRCTNPIAIAQLKVEIGHIFRDELGDFGRARNLYEQVAGSGLTVLAQLAQESLLSLPGDTGP